MSSMKHFLKANKKQKPNVFFAASKNFCNEEGNPIEWEVRILPTKENEAIKDECITFGGRGKANLTPKVDTKRMVAMQIVASTVFPDLHNAELQDSYGVKTPEDLLYALLDEAGEYTAYMMFVQEHNGLNISIDEKIEDAKN